jgi:hypothetical protein
MRLLVLSLTTLTLLPSVALAETSSREVPRVENFDDELVAGDLLSSTLERLDVRSRGDRRSLIRAREHFIPEMMHSVEDL